MESAQRYSVDYDWVWGRCRPTDVATLRVVASHEEPRLAAAAVRDFLASLPNDENGVRGAGGWAAYPVEGQTQALDLVSGGEDVADGIQYAADAAYEALSGCDGIRLQWRQLPAGDEPWRRGASQSRRGQ